ncbi:32652_t:CDS:10, partial [Gigaspora margarita]
RRQLVYWWNDYGSDIKLLNTKATGFCTQFFSNFKSYINSTNEISIPNLLGLTIVQNANFLQQKVHEKFPNLYPNFIKILKAQKATDRLQKGIKKRGQQLVENLDLDNSIKAGLLYNVNGIEDDPISFQNMAVELKETRNQLYQKSRQLKRYKASVEQRFSSSLDTESQELQSIINEIIQAQQLGSTILVSTEAYLTIILSQPCIQYKESRINQKKIKATGLAFRLEITIKCKKCKTVVEYANQAPGTNFTTCITAASLVGGINRQFLQNILAIIGITKQQCKSSHYSYQIPLYKEIENFGFDVSWSHSRNANESSGEFIYLEKVSGYNNRPIIAYHVVQKPCTTNQNGETIYLRKDIYIDEDLETNKTLSAIPFVNKIYTDLKHLSKNIRKSIKNRDSIPPTDQELCEIQIEGLLKHLQHDHSLCWTEVCWYKDNPELELAQPNLKGFTISELEEFRTYLKSTFRLPAGQSLKSYEAQHALAIIYNNDGLAYMLSQICNYCGICGFSEQGLKNIEKIRDDLQPFDLSKELISYGKKIQESIIRQEFLPTFAELIVDFNTRTKCLGCYSFPRCGPKGLYHISKFYFENGLLDQIPDKNFVKNLENNEPINLDKALDYILHNIFEFKSFREDQKEAITSFLQEKDIFVLMPTGASKSFCYTTTVLISRGLTIIFSPLKALIDDQVERIFAEIAAGIIRILYTTSEKLDWNNNFKTFLTNIASTIGIHNSWSKLGQLKILCPQALLLLMTATCTKDDAESILKNLKINTNFLVTHRVLEFWRNNLHYEVHKKKNMQENSLKKIKELIHESELGRTIVYCATHEQCDEMATWLCQKFNNQVGVYYSGLKAEEKWQSLLRWKRVITKVIIATNSFGMGINSKDIAFVSSSESHQD